MRRIKRFVLAENSEKEPMWKSSDNLSAGLSRMNSLEKSEAGDKETPLVSTFNHHGMT